ncbi:hypothetical protein [Polaribacter aestuariivivens]|uniref:hypothetical protein n=1 Tax=Polaribacter aestuariivivens TaxID=2304626 RepID=UPI001108C2CF|nr:hypothetical protein [Polaribacter aestuariivivens]
MVTYKEQQENKKAYVLLKDCELIGVFGNIKKVCDFMNGEDFYSYNTLIRKKEYPILYKGYKLYKTKPI